jgi:hypothetical protein
MNTGDREPESLAILERTRSAVLNVLVAVGVGIAASGLILRWRDRFALFRATDRVRQAMLAALLVLVVVSYLCRRVLGRRSLLRLPEHRAERFYQSHWVSAAVGALAIPLGLVYGWTVQPRMEAVAPFWVAALALGFLALPRASELDGLDDPFPNPGEPTG